MLDSEPAFIVIIVGGCGVRGVHGNSTHSPKKNC
jgi:hypothetical protein